MSRGPARPRVLAVVPQLFASTINGVVKPLTALHRAGRIEADVTLEAWVSPRQVKRADVVVFCRNVEPAYGGALEDALAWGKPVVYELDDNFFEIPPSYPGGGYYRSPECRRQLDRYVTGASLVRVYSDGLRCQLEGLGARVVRVEGFVDWALVPAAPPARAPQTVRVVYATSRTRDELAALVTNDIDRLLAAYPGRVEAWFWGYHPPELRHHPRVRCLDFVVDYDQYFRRFARAGFDIGLAPLRDDPFHRSKADTKFREYAACRIAGVYSDVDVYAGRVADQETGLLVSSREGEWFNALARLVEDEGLRAAIQEQAFAVARQRYRADRFEETWLDHLLGVLGDRPGDRVAAPAPAPPRRGCRGRVIHALGHAIGVLRDGQAAGGLSRRGRLRFHLRATWVLLRVRWRLRRPAGAG